MVIASHDCSVATTPISWGEFSVRAGVGVHPEFRGSQRHEHGTSLLDYRIASIPFFRYENAHHAFSAEIAGRLNEAFLFALTMFGELDQSRLTQAYREAMLLTSCAVFQEALLPDVCVDPNGEFILSHESDVGYIDIGLTGNRKISFHVRNDVNQALSCHADMDWDDYKIPSNLLKALEDFRACEKNEKT